MTLDPYNDPFGPPGDPSRGGGGGGVGGDTTPPRRPWGNTADDMPCPDPSTCMDVVTGQCRTYNPNREKVNETDTWDRGPGQGGRGYCRQRDGGGAGGAGGGAGRAGAGGAGGGGGAAGAAGSGMFGISNPGGRFNELYGMFDNQANTIWGHLERQMSGEDARYTPEVLAQLNAQARMDSTGAARASSQNLRQDAVQRGVGRSPIRALGDVQRQAVHSYTQASNQNRVRAAEANFEDRVGAIDRAERWLGQMQQYVMGLDATQADREKAIANIALGYARIQAERDMLREQLRNNIDLANLNNNAAMMRTIWGTPV